MILGKQFSAHETMNVLTSWESARVGMLVLPLLSV